jgi:hypothetical protein
MSSAKNTDTERKPRLAPEDYIRQADAAYIAAMREGRYPEIIDGIADLNYSVRNVMLIKSQLPNASKVMGMHAWNYLRRSVMEGERALKILAVSEGGAENAEGTENGGNSKIYRMSHVFDVSQTKGKELKEKTCSPETLDKYGERIKNAIAKLTYGYTFIEGEKTGVSSEDKTVSIQSGLSRADQLKAMIYGVAKIRTESKQREDGGEISQGRGLFNAIEESATAHIAARRLGLGGYPLKAADFKGFEDDALMKFTTNLHYVKTGAQRITNAVERYVSEAQSADALRAVRAAEQLGAADPAVVNIPGYYPIFNANVPGAAPSGRPEAEAGG